MIRFLRDAENLEGKRVIVRVDVNVPMSDGVVKDDFRIRRIFPTLEFLKEHGAIPIVISHHSRGNQTLQPVAEYMGRWMKTQFVADIFGTDAFSGAERGTVYVCE